jgi:hypothetical protein
MGIFQALIRKSEGRIYLTGTSKNPFFTPAGCDNVRHIRPIKQRTPLQHERLRTLGI